MKNTLLILALLLTPILLTGQSNDTANKWYDYSGKEIPMHKYRQMHEQTYFKMIRRDSTGNHYYFIPRNQKGMLNATQMERIRSEIQDPTIAFDKPLAILLYQGVDDCNQHFAGSYMFQQLYELLRYDLNELNDNPPYFAYTDDQGLGQAKSALKFYADQGAISEYFFPHKYKCASFVCIQPDGKYALILGDAGIKGRLRTCRE